MNELKLYNETIGENCKLPSKFRLEFRGFNICEFADTLIRSIPRFGLDDDRVSRTTGAVEKALAWLVATMMSSLDSLKVKISHVAKARVGIRANRQRAVATIIFIRTSKGNTVDKNDVRSSGPSSPSDTNYLHPVRPGGHPFGKVSE